LRHQTSRLAFQRCDGVENHKKTGTFKVPVFICSDACARNRLSITSVRQHYGEEVDDYLRFTFVAHSSAAAQFQ